MRAKVLILLLGLIPLLPRTAVAGKLVPAAPREREIILDLAKDANAANKDRQPELADQTASVCLAKISALRPESKVDSDASKLAALCWLEKAKALQALGRRGQAATAAQGCLQAFAAIDPDEYLEKRRHCAALAQSAREVQPPPVIPGAIEEPPFSLTVGFPLAAPGFHFLLSDGGSLPEDMHFSVQALGLELGATLPTQWPRRLHIQPGLFFQWETLFRSVASVPTSKADTFTFGVGVTLRYVRWPVQLEVTPAIGISYINADNKKEESGGESGLRLRSDSKSDYLHYYTDTNGGDKALDLRLVVRVGWGDSSIVRRWIGASVGLYLAGGGSATPWSLKEAGNNNRGSFHSAYVVLGPYVRFCFQCLSSTTRPALQSNWSSQ